MSSLAALKASPGDVDPHSFLSADRLKLIFLVLYFKKTPSFRTWLLLAENR
jgi:hypothetical protein